MNDAQKIAIGKALYALGIKDACLACGGTKIEIVQQFMTVPTSMANLQGGKNAGVICVGVSCGNCGHLSLFQVEKVLAKEAATRLQSPPT